MSSEPHAGVGVLPVRASSVEEHLPHTPAQLRTRASMTRTRTETETDFPIGVNLREIIPTGVRSVSRRSREILRAILYFPKQSLRCRGSHGVAKGPLEGLVTPPRCRLEFCIAIYSAW